MRGSFLLVILAGCGRFGFDVGDLDPDLVARIKVQHGAGDGTIVGPNGFTCTADPCTLDVAPGTTVSFRGLATADSWFGGWTGPCGGNFDCEFQADADVTLLGDFSPIPNRVFVTSTTTNGQIGGIAGADAICGARAEAAGLIGTFIAYLGDSTTTATSRLVGSRGWIRTDGAPFADAPTGFANGELHFPVRLDEFGNDLGDVDVYTGTNYGATTGNLCLDWTSGDGVDSGTTNEVKYGFDAPTGRTRACGFQAHLLCTEIGRVRTVTTRPDTGKLAFMTTNGGAPGGGRASADTHCASEAASAGLTGNFLAAVATTTESISSRFTAAQIYRRIDDVRLLRSPGLFTTDWLDVPPQLDQFGDIVSSDYWTGAPRMDVVPNANDNCNDWTDSSPSVDGQLHGSTSTDLRMPAKADPCDSVMPLLCLAN